MQRARLLDKEWPGCECERESLQSEGGKPVADDEVVARILTSPEGYDITTRALVATKLQSVYSCGLSVIRSGASDAEISNTVDQLTRASETSSLVGAIVLPVADIRALRDEEAWFGVYATDDGNKTHHVDIAGTWPNSGSNKEKRKRQDDRRMRLRDKFASRILFANDAAGLIAQLRAAGL